MSNSNHIFRWTIVGRWIATAGIGLVVALGYAFFRPAHAQDPRSRPANTAAGADKNAATPPSKAEGGLRTEQEILDEARSKTSSGESGQPVKEADHGSRDLLEWLPWLFFVGAICIVSIVAVAFAVERFLGLRGSKVLPTDLAAGLRAMASRKGDFDLRHAMRLCRQYPSSLAVVVRAMLAKVGRPLPEVEKALTDACEHEASRLFTNVRVQNLAFNVAPMLGLAGTVCGMIECFYKTAHLPVEVSKMDSLATGIYLALFCTLAGLIVAIPAGILSHLFESRILSLFQRIEDVARSLVPHLERFEGQPRQSAGDKQPVVGGETVRVGPSRQSVPSDKQPIAATIIEMPRDDEDDFDDEDDDPLVVPKGKKAERRS